MPETEYVLDASFIVDYLRGSARVKPLREKILRATCYISAITWAEVVSKFERAEGAGKGADDNLVHLGEIQPVTRESARSAALLHAELKKKRPKLSLGDAFVIALAREKGCITVTTDNDFAGLPKTTVIR